ncbi:unnamed protein product, partial [Candidula unifasciata]
MMMSTVMSHIINPLCHSQLYQQFPWVDLDADYDSSEIGSPLSRDRRSTNSTTGSKSVWQKIEEFYSDKNNMAMYCVLPILILIYGGCSSIYCIHKCRHISKDANTRGSRRRTNIIFNNSGNEGLKDGRHRPVSQISSAWTDFHMDTSGSGWSVQTEGQPLRLPSLSPLPWQVHCREGAMAPSRQ